MRTFSRADWDRAQEEWRDFSDEWKEVRHLAAMRGILFPPSGTKWDDWRDDHPTQRAMLIRAIRETPVLLRTAVGRSRSWSEVIDCVTGQRDEMRREGVEVEDREILRARAEQPTHRESTMALGGILERLAESVGTGMIGTGRGKTGVSNGGIQTGSGPSTVLIPGDLAQPEPRPLPPSEDV